MSESSKTMIAHEEKHGVPSILQRSVSQGAKEFFAMVKAVEVPELCVTAHREMGIFAMISFVGTCSWTLMIELPPETASKISQAFAGFEIEYDSPDMGDIAGELANVLAGFISANLEKENFKAQMSLPLVARDSVLDLLLPEDVNSTRLAFDSEAGHFWLEIFVSSHCLVGPH